MNLAVAINSKENQVGLRFDYLSHRSYNKHEINLIGYPYKLFVTIILFKRSFKKRRNQISL